MKPKTLLEKAKLIQVTRDSSTPITKELTELTMAWVRDEISIKQAEAALGKKNILYLFANVLKVYILNLEK